MMNNSPGNDNRQIDTQIDSKVIYKDEIQKLSMIKISSEPKKFMADKLSNCRVY